ncbi:MAG: hypothetical protein QOH00_2095 [Gaiellales bacterium]|jgi:uncharacterized protein YndB with AHSA1/START domain|nr:hypothetical protein [Gaiellales bacterium]
MIAPLERAMAVEVDQQVHIAAPSERVWRALVEQDELRRWLFASAVADVRPGGSWRFTFPHWPSARGLQHPALNFGGPIVELVPGRVLAVQFEPPYWGVLRVEIAAEGDGTDLRVTQRGFEGNEEWLADFRGGWGSFTDRLAVLCETGEVPTARRLEETRAAARTLEPAELAGALAQLAPRGPALRPYWYADGGRVTLVVPGLGAANGYEPRREEARDVLCLALPAGADLQAARSSLERSLPRRGWTAAGPLRAAVDPAHPEAGCELALPHRPAVDPADPEPFVRAFERCFCAPGRAAAAAYFAPGGALALAGGPHPRPLDTPISRLPAEAVARFWRLRLGSDGVLTADWEGGGWTAARNRGTSTWTFADDGRIERLVLRFDPAVPRMVAA